MSTATESAVIVAVPAAEPAVGAHRQRFDRAAGWGVPAHVTVLFPFVRPDEIDDEVLARLARAVLTVPAFDATWSRTGWFAEQVLWVAPEPDAAFRALTAAACAAFPAYRPYRGEHADVVPHLTVGHDVPVEQLRAAERAVLPLLPFGQPVTHVEVICGTDSPGSWLPLARLPLGPAGLEVTAG